MENLEQSSKINFYSKEYQLKNLIKTPKALSEFVRLKSEDVEAFEKTQKIFKTLITPYYASLMDPEDPNCPIRLQCVPNLDELKKSPHTFNDPLAEEAHMPVPYLVHRYPDHVLFLLTDLCVLYCRYCTRKRFTSQNDRPSKSQLDEMISYIQNHPQITDVLISGGDPLFGPLDRLEYVLKKLHQISHLDFIRIGSRVPVTCPMLITREMVDMLKSYPPLYINTHFNHPKEITPYSIRACNMLADAGIVLGNQTVLLKGINDQASIICELNKKLLKMRVRPYYLLQCDPVFGADHFRTPISTGLEIIKSLRGKISGMAIPHFIVDLPGGGGKISMVPEYLEKIEGNTYYFKNAEGMIYTYIQP